MRLAWFNIAHDRTRFAVTVLGITCAVFLMVFQGSVLAGFMGAASKIIDSTDADLWITGRGVKCFEFPVQIERRLAEIARGIPGVAATSRICTRQVQFRKPDGSSQLVVLIGAEAGAGAGFPMPHLTPGSLSLEPEALVVDRSNSALLNVERLPADVELNRMRAHVVAETSGFSSFLGSPYVFTAYNDAARYIELPPEETMFILVRLQPGVPAQQTRRALELRLPNVDIWTREEFSNRARMYWVSQTGAGGAILMAAVLGFLVGLAVASQAIYAVTMENIEEFATLKAIGASHSFVRRIIMTQALICGVVGYILGVLLTTPMIHAAESTIAWILTPWWLPAGALLPTLAMCILASIVSVRSALRIEPAKVFRA
jgi:putative ABC transport system permease protein